MCGVSKISLTGEEAPRRRIVYRLCGRRPGIADDTSVCYADVVYADKEFAFWLSNRPTHGRVWYVVKEEELVIREKEFCDGMLLYRGVDYLTNETTAWYPSIKDIVNCLKQRDAVIERYTIQHVKLSCAALKEKQLKEIVTEFKVDGRNRPFTRISFNLDGTAAADFDRGKVYFPDRSFKDVVPGPYVVDIVKDLDTYGFVVGRPQRLKAPCLDDVLDWAWDTLHSGNLIRVVNVRFGTYFLYTDYDCSDITKRRVEDFSYIRPVTSAYSAGVERAKVINDSLLPFMESDVESLCDGIVNESITVEVHSVRSLIYSSAWGRAVSDAEIDNLFASFPSSVVYARFAHKVPFITSSVFYDKMIDDLVSAGVVRCVQYALSRINLIIMEPQSPESQLEFARYDEEDIQKIYALIAEINRTADEALKHIFAKRGLF